MGKTRVAILISGRGSNMEALLAAMADPGFPAEPAIVVSNRPGAAGLIKAQAGGVSTAAIDHTDFPDRESFEDRVHAALTNARADFVCLAGFMRILTPSFRAKWADRMINIHASLLPAFPGLNTHERALEAGVKVHGATVHWVTDELDAGPIIGQVGVPVLAGDDPDTLGARVLVEEHKLYPACLAHALDASTTREKSAQDWDPTDTLFAGPALRALSDVDPEV